MYNLYTREWVSVLSNSTYENAVAQARIKWENCYIKEGKNKVIDSVLDWRGNKVGFIVGFVEPE